jgi:hypothetical protein
MAAAVIDQQFPQMDKFFNTTHDFEDFLTNKLFQTPIRNTSSKLVIPLFTFVVGANMPQGELVDLDSPYHRNHEYSKFCRSVFEDPLSRISPEMIEYISRFEMVDIHQYNILIDPCYSPTAPFAKQGILHGLKMYFPSLSFPVENNMTFQHNDTQVTAISSSMDILIVADSVTHNDIYNYLSIIESLREIMFVDYLVNILDCTSYMLRDFWVNNCSNKIWISTPECMLLDDQLKYNPMLTISKSKSKSKLTEVKHHNMGSDIELRWVSFVEDELEFTNLESIIDIADQTTHKVNILNMYEFLKNDMKIKLLENDILALIKLLALETYTLNFKLSDTTEFRISNITYAQFTDLWRSNKLFSERILNLIDPYFKGNVTKFITKFLVKLEQRLLDDTIKMSQLYQEEINGIFVKLNTVFPEDFKDTPIQYPVPREFIYQYLRKYNVIV